METIQNLSSFQKRVYVALSRIPTGKVTTYGELANYLDCKSSQAVGQALKKNPYAPQIPCHRVIKSNTYHIGGFMGKTEGEEITKKINRLKDEGVLFDSNGFLIDKSLLYDFEDDPSLDDLDLEAIIFEIIHPTPLLHIK